MANGHFLNHRGIGGGVAYFQRLIAVLSLFVLCSPSWAFSMYEQWKVSAPVQFPPGVGSTPEEACDNFSPGFVAAKPGGHDLQPGYVEYSDTILYCRFKNTSGSNLFSWVIVKTAPSCPANSTDDGSGNCTCQPGFDQDFDSSGHPICVQPEDLSCAANSFKWNAWTTDRDRMGVISMSTKPNFDVPFLVCMPLAGAPSKGCKHMFTGTSAYRMGDDEPWKLEGHSWALGPNDLAEAGGSLECVPGQDDIPGEPPTRNDRPEGCEHGYAGQVNGLDVCVDRASGEIQGQDVSTTQDAQGNIKETVTSITCKKENCEVTRTIRDPGATEGTTTTTTMTRTAYCAKNPESSVCQGSTDETGSTKNQNGRGGAGGGGGGDGLDGFCVDNPDSIICKKSSFSGSCAASFSCDGDAIQCSIAQEQHMRNCALFETPSDESNLYKDNKGKEGNQTNDLPGNSTVDLAGRIDTSNALGAGACIPDLNVTVYGQSITLPISVVCPWLGTLGQILVAVSLLLAARIVMRG